MVIDQYLFINWYIKLAIQDLTILGVPKHDDEEDKDQDNDDEKGNNDSNHVERLIDVTKCEFEVIPELNKQYLAHCSSGQEMLIFIFLISG